MSKHENPVRLRHMLEHAQEAVSMMAGKTRLSLDESRTLSLALVRLIEIVGEAANRVSKKTQQKYPQIPWPLIIGMRNRLVHDYTVIDLDIVWQTVTEELPPLIVELQEVIAQEEA